MPDLDVTGVSAVTLADDDGLLIIDQSTGSVKKALAGRLSRDYGAIYGDWPVAGAGFQTIADLATADLVAGGVDDFFTTALAVRGVTATPSAGKLVPSRSGIYRVWYTATILVVPVTGSMPALAATLSARYNGTIIPGTKAFHGIGDGSGAYLNNDGIPLALAAEAIIDITTAGQDLTLACTMTKDGGTATAFLISVLHATLGMERLDDT